MADDQIRARCAGGSDRVLGGGGKRQQHALLAQIGVDRRPRAPGTTRRAAAPPNRPRTGPKQRAPGTNTVVADPAPGMRRPHRLTRPTDS